MEIIYRAKDGTEFTDADKAVEYEAKLQNEEEVKNEPLYFDSLGKAVDNYGVAEFALVQDNADWENFCTILRESGESYVGDYYDYEGAVLLYGLFGDHWVMIHDYDDTTLANVNFLKTAINLIDKYSE